MLLVLFKHVLLAGATWHLLLFLVLLTIWIYLVDELDWVKILRIKHITLALERRLECHSCSAAWLSGSSLRCTTALRHG